MIRRIAHGRAIGLGFALLASSTGAGCDTVRTKVRAVVCEPTAAGGGGGSSTGAAGHGAAGSPATAGEPAAGAAAPAEPAHAAAAPHGKASKSSKSKAGDSKRPTGPSSQTDTHAHDTPSEHATHEHSQPAEEAPRLTAAAKFALPFAWEKSPAEPLSLARTYLRELADDNAQHMAKGPAFFRPFGSAETPRATVVSCTDSRVQTSSFDSSPDNDDYTVRNLGNQIELGLGSVQYGIEHLNTPVLLILGHTGCEAIQAAANDGHGFEEPIRRELSGIRTKKQKGRLDDKHWASAVEDNVHDQVKAALKRFGSRVTSGELTIIGAVYDFRNDMMRGPGKLVVVDVNGNRDESRLKAFGEAILSTPNPKKKPGPALNPLDRLAQALSESANFDSEDEDDFEEGEDTEAAPAPAPAAAPKAAAMPADRAHH